MFLFYSAFITHTLIVVCQVDPGDLLVVQVPGHGVHGAGGLVPPCGEHLGPSLHLGRGTEPLVTGVTKSLSRS